MSRLLILCIISLIIPEIVFAENTTSSQYTGTWISIVPPLIAIGTALLLRQVIPAVFLGIWMGAWIIHDFSFSGLGLGLLESVQIYILSALADPDHASIIVFTLMIGGLVGVISANGGMLGIVNWMTGYISTRKSAQAGAGLLGLGIFFDDYANSLIVGNTLRPITDRLKISREKLAYIVDSTSAPVSAIAFVTTWIGYEVGLIGASIKTLEGFTLNAYEVFLSSIPYSFYPLLALFFMFLISLSGRDFGPMLKAEKAALQDRNTSNDQAPVKHSDFDEELAALTPDPEKPQRAINALIPILTLIAGVVSGLWITGEGDSLRAIIGSADSYKALIWASFTAVVVSILLSTSQGILNLESAINAWFKGIKSMLMAMIILILAWALASITEQLDTAGFLIQALGDWLPASLLPALVFLLSAATAFATGSSWGTMGILVPLVLPLTWAVTPQSGDPSDMIILYSSVSSILAGAVWGDHCSPISDTTILSASASGCNHIAHVQTQLPYALTVGTTAILLGTLPSAMGLHWTISLLAGATALIAILFIFGRKAESA